MQLHYTCTWRRGAHDHNFPFVKYPKGRNNNVGLQTKFFKVGGSAVTNGNGCIARISLEREQDTHWTTNNIAAADNHNMFPAGLNFITFQEFHNALRSGRYKSIATGNHSAKVLRMKTIYIFGRINCFSDLLLGNMFW